MTPLRLPGPPRRSSLLLGAFVVLLMSSPALLTDRGFGPDFTNHLWLVAHQREAIAQHGLPTFFLHAGGVGSFQPYFGFYGGTLYALGGLFAMVLGNEAGYLTVLVLALGAAYFGLLWLARQLGGPDWAGHAAAITFLTSPYLITDVYARGAWPETVALCAIPVVAAAGLALLRADVVRAGPAAAFAGGVVLFTGSHNITLLWGTIVLAVLSGLLLALGARVPLRRLAFVVGLGLLATGVNGWFLLFDVLRASDTQAGLAGLDWNQTGFFNEPRWLLDPLRGVPPESTTSGLAVAAPVLPLLWVLVVSARRRGWDRRVLALVLGLVAVLLVLTCWRGFWDGAPDALTKIQFPYRLEGYVALLVAAAVAVAASRSSWQVARTTLALVCVASIGLGTWQAWSDRNTTTVGSMPVRSQAALDPSTKPPSFYDLGFYADSSRPVVQTKAFRVIDLPIPVPGTDSQTVTVDWPAGMDPVATNVLGGPYVVRMDGVQVVGRTAAGRVVARRLVNGTGPLEVKVSRVGGAVRMLGPAVTVVSLATLFGLLLVLRRRGRPRARRRMSGRSATVGPLRS